MFEVDMAEVICPDFRLDCNRR